MYLDSFEALNETLLELKRSKEREAHLAEENRVILASLSSLSNAETKYQIFDELNQVLEKYISFSDFIVISKAKDSQKFKTFLSSNPEFDNTVWKNGEKFHRVLQGESILLYEPNNIPEFDQLNHTLKRTIKSALLTGVQAQASDSVLLFLGNKKGQFDIETRMTLSHFRPLLERAIIDIEHKYELQKLVEVRTKELLEARIAAEKANEAKSQFLAMMSHEIRTPLSAVLGIIEILRDEANPTQQKLLERMENSAELLHTIIGDILDLSKIDSGHFILYQTWTNLFSKFNQSFEYYEKQAKNKGLSFHQDIYISQEYEYFVDSVRIMQIISNLVGNAIKFTQVGNIELTIKADNANLYITVKDTGIGIDYSLIDRLFSPFIQADNTKSRSYGGAGLGLTITKRLVELMRGSINLTSEVNKGTTFYIVLPMKIRPVQKTETDDHSIALLSDLKSDNGSDTDKARRILVVEDTKTNQMVIELLLTRMGYLVTIANNGIEALDLLERDDEFDLIFMDISMPKMDGLEATRRLRQKNIQIPIIALTAHSVNDEKETYLAAGINEVVMKPARSKQLTKIINEFF